MSTKTLPKNDILQGLKSQDDSMIRYIYDQYAPGIYNYVQRNSGTLTEAQDIFQEVIIVLYRNVKKDDFELTSALSTYLYAIAKYLWLKKLNRAKKQVTIEDVGELTVDAKTEAEIIKTERRQFFREKFALLGNDCRQLLTLAFEGKTSVEIAKQMGYGSEGYARKKKHGCKKKLEKLIKSDRRFDELKN